MMKDTPFVAGDAGGLRPTLSQSEAKTLTLAAWSSSGIRRKPSGIYAGKVSFHEAATIFADGFSTTVRGPDHSIDEHRCITVGWSSKRRLLMVAHADHGDLIRIVSARKLTRMERTAYEEES